MLKPTDVITDPPDESLPHIMYPSLKATRLQKSYLQKNPSVQPQQMGLLTNLIELLHLHLKHIMYPSLKATRLQKSYLQKNPSVQPQQMGLLTNLIELLHLHLKNGKNVMMTMMDLL